MFTVYMHKTPSGKVYIGITSSSNVTRRFGPDGVQYRSQMFGRAIRKYGWNNIEHIILKTGLTEDEAKQEEIRLISQYHSNDSRFGYNETPGGDIPYIYGKHHTEEAKKRIGESNKNKARTPEQLEKISAGVKKCWANPEYRDKQANRIVTEDTRKKQSLAHIGKIPNGETRQKMSISNKGKHIFSIEQRLGIAETVKAQHQKERELGIYRNCGHNGYHTAGSHWYNNGVKNIRIHGDCPEGFIPGKLKLNNTTINAEFVPTFDDAEDNEVTKEKVENVRKKFDDKSDVF